MEIPVTFTLNNVERKGIITKVAGAASTAHFHLYCDGYYFGQMSYFGGGRSSEVGWSFTSNNYPELSELSEYFGSVVTSWEDSHG